jgi:hypothetical protein
MKLAANVEIWFICSTRPNRERRAQGESPGVHGQRQKTKILISGVPPELITVAAPDAHIVWQAEMAFLQQQDALYPDEDVVAWEARYKSPDGLLLSTFDVSLASLPD